LFILIIFVVTLISAEVIIYSQKKLNIRLTLLIATLLVILLSIYNHFANTPSYNTDSDFLLSICAGLIMFGIPTSLFFMLCCLLKKQDENVKHISAVLFSALNTLVFPFIALITVCTLGIDCV
jgi:hypothetical protein